MNLLAVVPNYPPRSLVGSWIATHRFLTHLAARGHQVTVFAFRTRQKGWTHEGITVETGIRGRTHGAKLAAAADVVISHAGDGGYGLDIAAGKPTVRMIHGHGYANVGAATLAVANSHSLLDAANPECPAIVCHPPVNPAEHTTTPGELVTLVNCTADKGIDTLTAVAKNQPHRRYLAVRGGYGNQHTIRRPQVETIDSTPDMRSVWSRTRVLLAPSKFETWGMVAIEAACSGIPTIAHPTPGLRESLAGAGLFADRDDPTEWSRLLDRLDDPDEWAAWSTRARARAEELAAEGSTDRFADAVEALA